MHRVFVRHARFLVAFGIGLMLWFASLLVTPDPVTRALSAVNGGYVVYLAQIVWLAATLSREDLRRHSEQEDEGSTLIFLLALGAVAIGLTAIFMTLNRKSSGLGEALFALSAAPLGWALLHGLMAFRYAHLYYKPDPDAGLDFPGAQKAPGVMDFLYFSYVIGMTAQVSDVEVTTMRMRRTVLLHSVLSFFYNTVILALAVNAGVTLTS
ncbi:MAG: DUF1345 domain-containing protein [bacterium]